MKGVYYNIMSKRLFRSFTTQVELISKETIKPSSPTPSNHKTHRLSLMDRLSPSFYSPLVFFYPNSGTDSPLKIAEKSCQLKRSLSKTLTHYYPFAGRLETGAHAVNCNDDGVPFHTSRIRCGLLEILEADKHKALDVVVPPGTAWDNSYDGIIPRQPPPLLVLQLNYFDCGGMAVAVCLSHKIADACSLSTFVSNWAAMTRQPGKEVPPYFIPSPASNDSIEIPVREIELDSLNKPVTRIFVFPNSKLAHLKATIAATDLDRDTTTKYSRVDVVTALIYKCAVAAASKLNSGSFRPSTLFHAVNLRRRVVPHLPDTSVGNIAWGIAVPTKNRSELTLNALAAQIGKEKAQLNAGMKKLPEGKEVWSLISRFTNTNDVETYLCTSLCGYPLYDADFGFGKPIRVTSPGIPGKNSFILMDTPSGDGIEARVTLPKKDMAAFQNDEDLLAFVAQL